MRQAMVDTTVVDALQRQLAVAEERCRGLQWQMEQTTNEKATLHHEQTILNTCLKSVSSQLLLLQGQVRQLLDEKQQWEAHTAAPAISDGWRDLIQSWMREHCDTDIESVEQVQEWLGSLENERGRRAKDEEELRGAKESLALQSKALSELQTKHAELQAQHAKLLGHSNLKQKIHKVMEYKTQLQEQEQCIHQLQEENAKLLAEVNKYRGSFTETVGSKSKEKRSVPALVERTNQL